MLGAAAVTIWCEVALDVKDDFDDWHAHEHFPERLSIPGFLRGSRWVSTDGRNHYFMCYEVADEATTTSAAYLARLNNPTHWSRRMMPHHRNMTRSLCRVHASYGAGLGRELLTVRCTPGAPTGAIARELATLPSRQGCVAAHLLQNIPTPGMAQTEEQKLRGGDAVADWVVLVTGYGDLHFDVSLAGPGAVAGRYALACTMTAQDAASAAR